MIINIKHLAIKSGFELKFLFNWKSRLTNFAIELIKILDENAKPRAWIYRFSENGTWYVSVNPLPDDIRWAKENYENFEILPLYSLKCFEVQYETGD